jgi:hypothetical protein
VSFFAWSGAFVLFSDFKATINIYYSISMLKEQPMTSQINPNNIDGNYPVAGQPNNTQGMRDNFTNTKTNLQFAADEISDLQSKVVLKAALTGTTLDNNMNDGLIYAVKLQDVSYTYVPIVATAGSIDIDYSAGQFQQINPSAPVSLNFTNWPVTNSAGSVTVAFNVTNVSQTLTLPGAVTLGTTGVQGYTGGVITFAATGIYQFEFSTVDNGTTVTMRDLSRPLSLYTNAFGYTAGAGGTVTQSTNKATTVVLDKPSGQITMNNAALGAATIVNFTLTNSTIAATDLLVINHVSGGTIGAYTFNAVCGAGSATVYVRNATAGSLSEAVVLRFAVIKGSIT